MNAPQPAVRHGRGGGRNAPARRPIALQRRAVRPPQRSSSTETAVEYNEREKPFRALLAAEFQQKRRWIHPKQPRRHIQLPVEKSLEEERLGRERALLADVAHFVLLPAVEQTVWERERLIRAMEEWLERLEEEERTVDDQLKTLEKKEQKMQEVGRMIQELAKFAAQM